MKSNLVKNHAIIRCKILDLLKDLSEDRLLNTPEKLANNMLWNLGHVVRSTDFLILKFAGEKLNFPAELDAYFAKGSQVKDWKSTQGLKDAVYQAEKTCREALEKFLTPEKLNEKLKEAYPTSMGIVLETVADAVEYATIHEALHLGQLQLYAKLTE